MNTTMFLPKEIKVGFQERGGTYTGKLAYVIYKDEKGVLRKEKSFESWRDQKIEAESFENEPLSGFVLNKKAGGYDTGWNHRQTYVRVYDPRGFEFEITVENLLYILDNTSSIVGKGLEGEFVYAWHGKDLVLLPVNAPEYSELQKLNELRHNKNFVKAKDLIVGATYLRKDNKKMVFLGRFDEYQYNWYETEMEKKAKKQFYFAYADKDSKENEYSYSTFPAITQKFIEVLDDEVHANLNEMLEGLEWLRMYSPIDHSKTERKPMSLEKFLKYFENRSYGGDVIAENGKTYTIRMNPHAEKKIIFYGEYKEVQQNNGYFNTFMKKENLDNTYDGKVYDVHTLEDIFNVLKPHQNYVYLSNGNLHKVYFKNWNEHKVSQVSE